MLHACVSQPFLGRDFEKIFRFSSLQDSRRSRKPAVLVEMSIGRAAVPAELVVVKQGFAAGAVATFQFRWRDGVDDFERGACLGRRPLCICSSSFRLARHASAARAVPESRNLSKFIGSYRPYNTQEARSV